MPILPPDHEFVLRQIADGTVGGLMESMWVFALSADGRCGSVPPANLLLCSSL